MISTIQTTTQAAQHTVHYHSKIPGLIGVPVMIVGCIAVGWFLSGIWEDILAQR